MSHEDGVETSIQASHEDGGGAFKHHMKMVCKYPSITWRRCGSIWVERGLDRCWVLFGLEWYWKFPYMFCWLEGLQASHEDGVRVLQVLYADVLEHSNITWRQWECSSSSTCKSSSCRGNTQVTTGWQVDVDRSQTQFKVLRLVAQSIVDHHLLTIIIIRIIIISHHYPLLSIIIILHHHHHRWYHHHHSPSPSSPLLPSASPASPRGHQSLLLFFLVKKKKPNRSKEWLTDWPNFWWRHAYSPLHRWLTEWQTLTVGACL